MKKLEYYNPDDYQSTVEVCSYNYPTIGKLNNQFIMCLNGNGIPDSSFLNILV